MTTAQAIEFAASYAALTSAEVAVIRKLVSAAAFRGLESLLADHEAGDYQGHIGGRFTPLGSAYDRDAAMWQSAVETLADGPAYAAVVSTYGRDETIRRIKDWYNGPADAMTELEADVAREQARPAIEAAWRQRQADEAARELSRDRSHDIITDIGGGEYSKVD